MDGTLEVIRWHWPGGKASYDAGIASYQLQITWKCFRSGNHQDVLDLVSSINHISNISLLLDSRIFKPKQLRILDGRYLYSRLWFITKTERSWIPPSQGLQDCCSHHCGCMHGHSGHCGAHLHDEILNLGTQHYPQFTASTVFFWISKAHFSVAICWNREKKISDAFLQGWRFSSESISSRKKST